MSGAEAFREYYQRHADIVKARIAKYRANDPDGSKKRSRMMASLTSQYRAKPSIRLAVKIYALGHYGVRKPTFWKTFVKEVTDYAAAASTLGYL